MAALTRQFDLLITEISTSDWPEFSLNELLSRLHGTRGIVLTAHGPKEVPGWRKAGFASLYRKPVDFDCLLAGVKQLAVGVRHHRWDSLNLRPAGPQVERAVYNGTQAGRLMASMGTRFSLIRRHGSRYSRAQHQENSYTTCCNLLGTNPKRLRIACHPQNHRRCIQ